MKFKIGDRVRCEGAVGHASMRGQVGVVRAIHRKTYGIEFDNSIKGHDGYAGPFNRYGEAERCWNVQESEIKLECRVKKEVEVYELVNWCKKYYK